MLKIGYQNGSKNYVKIGANIFKICYSIDQENLSLIMDQMSFIF
jgi:hypothetical protein